VCRRGTGLRSRYHSTIIAGFGGALLQTLVQLLLLPCQAWVCLSAAFTALWRMRISKRNLLAWVTAAAAERGAPGGRLAYWKTMAASVISGLVAVFFSRFPPGAAVGVIWAVSPLAAWAMSRSREHKRMLPASDRAFLLHEAVLIWRYFDDFLRPEDHYLPPDNVQEQPAAGIARRTSPTNIGMALLSCLAAADLDLIPAERALDRIGRMLSTMEKLPKWKGHCYNWYDTGTLRPLRPTYVSSVDSGNLCSCLIALREGLLEQGTSRARDLAARADKLAEAMDFFLLYDGKRKLFHIGVDPETGVFSEGWYDLMASEARQTSYLAVARGEVEAKHWRRLGRALVSENHYSGMASWTGTMFEYLMPNLLMPDFPNSLIYESLCFCVHMQRRRTAGRNIPWGVSESGFYAFDGALNYQYKAPGGQKLGLKRGLDRELGISPYSTFLALAVSPRRAAENLRRLRDMSMEGRYGFYEAADFTPSRQTVSRNFELVRAYMAHHLGMSLVAIDNALRDNVMQNRFMRDRSMAAFRALLQEKVPVGAIVMKSPLREVPERVRRMPAEGWRRAGEDYDVWRPACHLLSNGSYSVLLTNTGLSRSLCGGISLSRFSPQLTGDHPGICFFLREGERAVSLAPAPYFDRGVQYGWQFDGGAARISAKGPPYALSLETRVPDGEDGELREVEIECFGEAEREAELLCYFEPVLSRREDFEAHPAFSKLALSTYPDPGGVVVTRRPRGGERMQCAAFFCDDASARFETSRERVLDRNRPNLETNLPVEGLFGVAVDPCVLCRVRLNLRPGEKVRLRFALALSVKPVDACNAAERMLKLPRGRSRPLDGCARQLKMTHRELEESFELLRQLAFHTNRRVLNAARAWENREGQAGLWRFGISGDLPILAVRVPDTNAAERALALVKQMRLRLRLMKYPERFLPPPGAKRPDGGAAGARAGAASGPARRDSYPRGGKRGRRYGRGLCRGVPCARGGGDARPLRASAGTGPLSPVPDAVFSDAGISRNGVSNGWQRALLHREWTASRGLEPGAGRRQIRLHHDGGGARASVVPERAGKQDHAVAQRPAPDGGDGNAPPAGGRTGNFALRGPGRFFPAP
jgi:cyclic beta-1,2-glucan synthetase